MDDGKTPAHPPRRRAPEVRPGFQRQRPRALQREGRGSRPLVGESSDRIYVVSHTDKSPKGAASRGRLIPFWGTNPGASARTQRRSAYLLPSGVRNPVISPTIVWTIGARCSASDPGYRHAMPVLAPIESCRRARSSGVECVKITHMKRTVAISNSVNVSTTRAIDPRQNVSQCPRDPPALGTNTLLASGPRTWTIASAVAVIAHG
jgi:hypothetical protein